MMMLLSKQKLFPNHKATASFLALVFALAVLNGLSSKTYASPKQEEHLSRSQSAVLQTESHTVPIAAGSAHTCILTPAGGVQCTGRNFYGQLGNGTTIDSTIPVDVSGLTWGVIAIAAGGAHTCALTTEGTVKCWGANEYGELGSGTTKNSTTPVDVVGLSSPVIAIAAGGLHTCALTEKGGVKCWGRNIYGQLGDGTTIDSATPVDVVGLTSGVTAITAGGLHTCAVTTEGGVKCWGYNPNGQLGNGTTTNSSIPVDVSQLPYPATAIGAGDRHTCALSIKGIVLCWGNNDSGQLGDGTATSSSIPVYVSELTAEFTAIAVGSAHTCAAVSSGGMKCWGWNIHGQLGNGTTSDSATPVDVSRFRSNVSAITAGVSYTCAVFNTIRYGQRIKCWGDNSYGQFGDGTVYNATVPVDAFTF